MKAIGALLPTFTTSSPAAAKREPVHSRLEGTGGVLYNRLFGRHPLSMTSCNRECCALYGLPAARTRSRSIVQRG